MASATAKSSSNMARKKLPKKRVSMYRLEDEGDVIHARKFEVVRGEYIVEADGYTINRIGDKSLMCNCPARITPCRHVKMYLYQKALGLDPKALATSLIYWEADEKEPEVMSLDDVRDIWDIPEGEDGTMDTGDTNYD